MPKCSQPNKSEFWHLHCSRSARTLSCSTSKGSRPSLTTLRRYICGECRSMGRIPASSWASRRGLESVATVKAGRSSFKRRMRFSQSMATSHLFIGTTTNAPTFRCTSTALATRNVALSDQAVCHRNLALGDAECVFISTRLMDDRFSVAFEFYINVAHAFVEHADFSQEFAVPAKVEASSVLPCAPQAVCAPLRVVAMDEFPFMQA